MSIWQQIPWQVYVLLIGLGLSLLVAVFVGQNVKTKLQGHKKLLKQIFFDLIPSPRAYINFLMLLTFFSVVVFAKDPTLVLISAFATLYFMNEWLKEIWAGRTWWRRKE